VSLLLDTHTFAWFCRGEVLSPGLRGFIEDYEADILVSAISAYEMALKYRLGLWPDAGPLVENFDSLVEEAHFRTLPVTARHAIHAGLLPVVHRDPFDRIIAAQAMAEGLRVVSKDRELKRLGAEVIWS
jgi:PIN domain nuclease of toxin-antitoxin system